MLIAAPSKKEAIPRLESLLAEGSMVTTKVIAYWSVAARSALVTTMLSVVLPTGSPETANV